MNHPIPANADLVDLIELDRRWSLEDALTARKSHRLAHSRVTRQGIGKARSEWLKGCREIMAPAQNQHGEGR